MFKYLIERRNVSMKTSLFAAIILSVLSVLPIYARAVDTSTIVRAPGQTMTQYVGIFLTSAEQLVDEVELSNPIPLKNALTGNTIAYCFTVNGQGYAIINVSNYCIHEYDLYNLHPVFKNDGKDYYYGGLFSYMYKNGTKIIDASSEQALPNEYLTEIYSKYAKDYPVISVESITEKISKRTAFANSIKTSLRGDSTMRVTSYQTTGQLTSTYSLTYINGFCGATACANLIDYCARRDGDYRIKNGLTQTQLINSLADYVMPTYGVDDLADGVNEYIAEVNTTLVNNPIELEATPQYAYSFGLVRDCIDQNIPITVGGETRMLDGNTRTSGHVVAIWGYGFTVDLVNDIYEYQLRVNNGWGSNSATITYSDTAPSSLVDHVFIN